MLNEKQIELLKNQKTVVLTTSDADNQPRSVFVEASIVRNDSIFITDNHLEKTIENIKQNEKVFILAYKEDYSYIVYITGTTIYHDNGNILEEIKNLPENKKYNPKSVIEIKINKIEEPFNI